MSKAALERLAIEVRSEVGVDEHEPFDPRLITEAYGVDVVPLSELDCRAEALEHFAGRRVEAFSGALIPTSAGTIIVENDFHDDDRRKSTLCHEIAHVVLEHEFSARVVGEMGCGATEAEQEREAAQFSGALMIPQTAAVRMAFKGMSDLEVATRHSVSLRVAGWRMGQTGARMIVDRTRKRGAR